MGASAFFKRAANDLRGDWRCARRHPNHREAPVRFDTRWGEATPSELRDNRAKRPALVRGELSSRRDHVIVDVQSGSHGLMLAHQHINSGQQWPPAAASGQRRPRRVRRCDLRAQPEPDPPARRRISSGGTKKMFAQIATVAWATISDATRISSSE
jgi:hypothetical protein